MFPEHHCFMQIINLPAVRTLLWEDLADRAPRNPTESTRKRFLTCQVDALRGEAAPQLPLPSLEGSTDHPTLPDSPDSSRRFINPLGTEMPNDQNQYLCPKNGGA